MKTWILNGGPDDELLLDRAFTHGLGIFETMLAIDGMLIRPDLHFDRMTYGCRRLKIEPPDSDEVIESISHELIGNKGRKRIRVMHTCGRGSLQQLKGEDIMTVISVSDVTERVEAIRVTLSPWPINERSSLAGIKCTSYAQNLVALDHAHQAGFDELIFANTKGDLCEAAMANVFIVSLGQLVTPSLGSGCLPGTARLRLLKIAEELGITVEERAISMDEAKRADAIFLSSATRGVMPISDWDRQSYHPNPLVEQLREAFEASLTQV